jgi:hypothetical protein
MKMELLNTLNLNTWQQEKELLLALQLRQFIALLAHRIQ